MRHHLIWLAVGSMFAVACDDTTALPVDSGVRVDASMTTSDAAAAVCPAAPPPGGSACGRDGLICEWPGDHRAGCRARAVCASGQWSLTPIAPCAPLPQVTCPDTRETAAGAACATEGAHCQYEDLGCDCTNCIDGPAVMCGGPTMWRCQAPHMDGACPAGKPLWGTPCSAAGKTCAYGCGAEGLAICDRGVWQPQDGGPCPISRRDAKQDIQYVDERERAALAAEMLRVPLATWRYRDPARAQRRHVGFIIEDQTPGSFLIDGGGNMVDLYGYASLLHLTVQQQAREIAALRREVERLRMPARRRHP